VYSAAVPRDSQLPAPYVRATPDGTVVQLVVVPRAKRSRLLGLHGGVPKVALAAPPIEGRANEELIAFLAQIFGLPRSQIELLRGGTSRQKSVLLRGVSKEEARCALENSQKRD